MACEMIDAELTRNFETLVVSKHEEKLDLDNQMERRIKKKYELFCQWKKTVESTRHDIHNLEKSLHDADLEEKMYHVELEALELEVKDTNERISRLEDDITHLKIENKRLKQVSEEKQQNAKESFCAHAAAMAYFKLYPKCYIDLDKSDSSAFSFYFLYDPNKSLQDQNYYVTLDRIDGEWEVLQIKPSISCEVEAIGHLKKTGDIHNFISHLYNIFVNHSINSKKLS